ncbi:major facilitator superfamily domain-containing protein [Scheffersomyces coipomensis]|uniref:major facilitator superfamily domain-containing protein n=1 Tax=Scheffersomyces coipomensis TaxID=1788519 RepID=UPI00315DFC50
MSLLAEHNALELEDRASLILPRESNKSQDIISEEHISIDSLTLIQNIIANKDGIYVVVSGFLCNFMVFGVGFSYGVFQEFYKSQDGPLSHCSDFQVAMVGTFGTALTYTCGIFNKTLLTYLKPRTLMLIGSILMSAGLILAGFCTELYQFILTQGLIYGVGSSFVYLPPVVCAPMFFNKHRAIAMGLLFSGTGFGGLAIAPLTRYLVSEIGFRWCLRTLGLINLALTILASTLVREPPVGTFKSNNKLFNINQLGSWKVCLQLAGSLLQAAGYLIPLIYMSSYAQTLGFTRGQGALFIGLNNAINAVFKVIFGFGGDEIGRLNMIIICNLLSAVTVFGLWYVESKSAYIGFIVLYGVFSGAIISLLPTCLLELFGAANYQSLSSIMYFCRGVGNFLGSPLAGLMIVNSGVKASDYKLPIIYNGVLLVASTACLAGVWGIAYTEKRQKTWKI